MAGSSGDDPARSGRESAAGESLRELIERTFLLGVGAAAVSKDRIQELVEEFVRGGQLSRDEGRQMVDDLVDRSRQEARSAMKRADSSLQGVLRDMGLISRRDLEDIEFRLRQLEHRLQLLEASSDTSGNGEMEDTGGHPS